MKKEQFEKAKEELLFIDNQLFNNIKTVNKNVEALESFINEKLKNENKIIKDYEEVLDNIRYSNDTKEQKTSKILLLNKEKRVNKTNAYEKKKTVSDIAEKVYNYYSKIYQFLLDETAKKTSNLIFKYCEAKRDFTQIKNYFDNNYKELHFRFYQDYDSFDFIYNSNNKINEQRTKRGFYKSYCYISKLTEYDKNYNSVFNDNSFKTAKSIFNDFEVKELNNILEYIEAYENAEKVYDLQKKHEQERENLEKKQEEEMTALNKLKLL